MSEFVDTRPPVALGENLNEPRAGGITVVSRKIVSFPLYETDAQRIEREAYGRPQRMVAYCVEVEKNGRKRTD